MTDKETDGYRIAVPPEFEEVFSHFYFAENTNAAPIRKTLLPTFQTIMVFNFGPASSLVSAQQTQIEVDKCVVLGPIKQAFDYTLPVGAKILVANFKDDAFYRFFGEALFQETAPRHPDQLLNENCLDNLWHELQQLDSATAQVNRLLQFCKPYIRPSNDTAKLLANFENGKLNPIKAVAAQTRQSERNIQLKHKKHFGYSAKEANRYLRFLQAVAFIEQHIAGGSKINWFELVEQLGYYDQSQLIHDFKYYLNLSPNRFLKFQQDICDPTS